MILRYLKKTEELVLFYSAYNYFELVGYADADFAGYQVDRKSTFRIEYFLRSSLISWGTKMQKSVTLTTIEAEYVATSSCCAQLVMIKQQPKDFGIHINTIPIMYDNTN